MSKTVVSLDLVVIRGPFLATSWPTYLSARYASGLAPAAVAALRLPPPRRRRGGEVLRAPYARQCSYSDAQFVAVEVYT